MEIKYSDGFKKDMQRLFSWWWAPYRWFQKIINIPWEINQYFQRANRGYADKDLWGFDYYLLRMLPPAIRDMANRKMGYPVCYDEIKSFKDWQRALRRLADYLEAGLHIDCMEKRCERLKERNEREFNEGMRLFHRYFFSLWD